jgi:hypothetical protein
MFFLLEKILKVAAISGATKVVAAWIKLLVIMHADKMEAQKR